MTTAPKFKEGDEVQIRRTMHVDDDTGLPVVTRGDRGIVSEVRENDGSRSYRIDFTFGDEAGDYWYMNEADLLPAEEPSPKIALEPDPALELLLAEEDGLRAGLRSLEEFKARVVEAVVRHPEGCETGKRSFLESLGLEWPRREVEILVTIDLARDDDPEEVARAVRSYLSTRGSNVAASVQRY